VFAESMKIAGRKGLGDEAEPHSHVERSICSGASGDLRVTARRGDRAACPFPISISNGDRSGPILVEDPCSLLLRQLSSAFTN